jgi:polysaccharide export outer membrane protein
MGFSFLTLYACGVIYTSPAVNDTSGQVNIVEVTLQSIANANRSPYTPKQLPAVFNQTINTPSEGPFYSDEHRVTLPNKHPSIDLPPRAAPNPYKLGISDVVLLATPASQTTAALATFIAPQNRYQGYTIQDDGAISIPDIGRIEIAGQTVEEAEATLFQAMVKNQVEPNFSLEIVEYNARSVSVGGAVKLPNVMPVTMKPLTLQNALQNAGGVISVMPEHTLIRIFRDGKRYQIPLKKLQAQPNLQSFILQDGDNIFVENGFQKQIALVDANSQALAGLQIKTDIRLEQSEAARRTFIVKLELGAVKREYVFMAGEVAKQGRFPLPFNNTASLADAIYSDNGIRTREGNLSQIYILRASNTVPVVTAYHLDAKNAINLLLATKMQLRPNDVVFVAEQRVTAWNRVISQILPSFNVANLADLVVN